VVSVRGFANSPTSPAGGANRNTNEGDPNKAAFPSGSKKDAKGSDTSRGQVGPTTSATEKKEPYMDTPKQPNASAPAHGKPGSKQALHSEDFADEADGRTFANEPLKDKK